jgi:hypothetical protein
MLLLLLMLYTDVVVVVLLPPVLVVRMILLFLVVVSLLTIRGPVIDGIALPFMAVVVVVAVNAVAVAADDPVGISRRYR